MCDNITFLHIRPNNNKSFFESIIDTSYRILSSNIVNPANNELCELISQHNMISICNSNRPIEIIKSNGADSHIIFDGDDNNYMIMVYDQNLNNNLHKMEQDRRDELFNLYASGLIHYCRNNIAMFGVI